MIGYPETTGEGAGAPPLVAWAETVFAPGGDLEEALRLEHRPQQEAMALSAAAAFAADRPLLFEAGTGVGKSLAYLIPAILHAVDSERQAIVSTHTISLQEQIKDKDLPLCRALFAGVPGLARYREFKTALLVGRGNYLCTARLARAIESRSELFPTAEQEALEQICDWSTVTRTGLLQELDPAPPPQVWEWVNADSTTCNKRNCSPETCFFRAARARLRHAQVIVVNHSLLFALLGAGHQPGPDTRGVLFADDFVVLDEAHTVPAVATDHFGARISSYGLARLLRRLYHPKREKGLLARLGDRQDVRSVEASIHAAEAFFSDVRNTHLNRSSVARIYRENYCPGAAQQPLAELAGRLADRANKAAEGPAREELLDLRTRLVNYQTGIGAHLAMAEEHHVHWVERGGRNGDIVSLCTAPLDVAPQLQAHLFARGTSVLMTSATLAEGDSMETFKAKAGALGQDSEKVTSPFDFERNLRVFVASDAPDPGRKEGRLDLDFLADAIAFCTLRVRGGSLVLFTSYADMNEVANRLAPTYQGAGRPFDLQGGGRPRTELARRLAEDGNGILFGTDSFWTGVDIPGPSLSQVVVTRLPFENPSHPVAEARSEFVQSRGGHPFGEITLPDAVIKFRQGIGRLIRSKTDRGTVTLLDSRLLTKSYGRRFLGVLPVPTFARFCRADREEAFQPLEAEGAG